MADSTAQVAAGCDHLAEQVAPPGDPRTIGKRYLKNHGPASCCQFDEYPAPGYVVTDEKSAAARMVA